MMASRSCAFHARYQDSAKARAAGSVTVMGSPGERGAVVVEVLAGVRRLETVDDLQERGDALLGLEGGVGPAHVGLDPARVRDDAGEALGLEFVRQGQIGRASC